MSVPATPHLPGLAATSNITDLDLRAVSDAIHAGQFSSVEATEAYLARIQQHDGVLQGFITVTAERALAQARQADAELAHRESRGPLHGVPIALKDLISVKGVRLTGGSQVFAHHIADEDSPIATKLDEAGAVMLGKLTMHEFAFGRAATDGSLADGPFPTGRNPWNIERVTGGSSSGSGVAASAGFCAGALGSDTGGSIRGPAALCGLVGHKPSYGLVTRRGVLPQCWSLDHVGPMTRGVWDAAILLQAIAGHDPGDAATSQGRPPSYTRDLENGVRGMKFGILKRYYLDWPGLDPEVKAATYAAYRELERQGAQLVEVDAPTLDQAQGIWGAMLTEMYEYHRDLLVEQPEHYRTPTRLLMLASALFPAADFVRAQRLRARLAREIAEVLKQVDALVFPGQSEPATPFPADPTPTELVRAASRYTNVWNLVGLPACVLPSGFTQDGLPLSLQIVGRPYDDATVLRIARSYERATQWHTRRPDPAGLAPGGVMAVSENMTGADILAAAKVLAPQIRAASDEIEAGRRLPLPLVQAMKDAGVFRMPMPRSWGGPEVDPMTQIRIVEELSIANASVGWCTMIGADAGFFTAFLDDAVGRALYPDLDLVTASSTRPTGHAEIVPGGYRVSGQWQFSSGCQHSAYLVANSFTFDCGVQRFLADGSPESRLSFLRADQVEILDTWTTTGLRGSGSHDFTATNVFVPAELTFNTRTSPLLRDGPLYSMPFLFVINGAGVPLGNARAAIDALIELASSKQTLARTGLRDEAWVQTSVARAEMLLSGARGFVFDAVGDVWDALVKGEPLTMRQRARFRLSLTASSQMSLEAVDLMYEAAGGTSIYAVNPLDRIFRDAHVINQHITNSPKVYEQAGQLLLGIDAGLPGF